MRIGFVFDTTRGYEKTMPLDDLSPDAAFLCARLTCELAAELEALGKALVVRSLTDPSEKTKKHAVATSN